MECDHDDHIIVHDHSSGDRICTGCGTVLESFVFDTVRDCDRYGVRDPIQENIQEITRDKRTETILSMGHDMKLPESVINTALVLFAEVVASGLRARFTNLRSFAASALYYACKIEDVDRAEIEVTSNCHVTTKELTLSNKHFRRALISTPWAAKISVPANPVRMIPRFLDTICATPALVRHEDKQRIRRLSEDIGNLAGHSGILEGKTPECCCIAFIYTTLRDLGYPESLLGEICGRCGLTPNTIENAMTILKSAP